MNKNIKRIKKIFNITQYYVGWGRKKSGKKAVELAEKNSSSFLLLEDGFIRSIGLGVDGDESFSIVKDSVGIYYDATAPSQLENILKNHKFTENEIREAKESINLIKEKKISKYNNSSLILPEYLKNNKQKVLIVAQTKGDMSLEYGLASEELAKNMLKEALNKNPDSEIYLKIHPDVLSGKKESNIDLEYAKKYCKIINDNIHPVVLLEAFDRVYTQTSQMGFEALFLGKETHIFGAPFYAGWNLENLIWHLDKNKKEEILKRRGKSLTIEEVFYGAYCLYSEYFNPFSKEKSNLVDTVETIAKYREIYLKNSGDLYFFGFSFWKRKNSLNFFKTFKKGDVFFCKNLDDALTKGLKSSSKIFIWGKKEFEEVEEFAKEKSIEIFRVEDGFVRSVTLGSDLTKAYSLVVDSRGIYFDPNSSSDLEEILNTHKFDKKTLKRAEKIRDYLIENRISKYNIHRDKKLNFNTSKKIVLVVGQVEDDASIIYGGEKMSNLELLKRVYEKRKDEFIIYKPHPDVEAGNRKGKIDKKITLKYANEVISDISLPSLLDACDELHTITSLSGFEALIRGKKVYTYGLPFYASWGLTIDEKSCKRRTRKLSILELIAGSYILYPRYIDPESGKLCEIEVTLKNIELMKRKYNSSRLYRFAINIRNFISRKSQLILKVILGE